MDLETVDETLRTFSLGRLVPVDLRTIWQNETHNFNQWLAQPENIDLLAETLELDDLEVEGCEINVGPFRADIVCAEADTGNRVLIENQLEDTDHKHLGQLLVYAAGLKAATIIWIAQHFTEEHRAALDWLNSNTGENFNFFGVQIELWRIGQSEVAPRFNIVSKPNDWSKRMSEAASQSKVITETKQTQLEYWKAFNEYLASNSKFIKPRKARPQHWCNYAAGGSDFTLSAQMNTKNRLICIKLIIKGANAKAYFRAFQAEQAQIEKAIGEALIWRELPDKERSYVEIEMEADPLDSSNWTVQHKWLCEKLEAFQKAFSPRIKQVDPTSHFQVSSAVEA